MTTTRLVLASLAAAALVAVTAVVALGAPTAARTSAARHEYCTPGQKAAYAKQVTSLRRKAAQAHRGRAALLKQMARAQAKLAACN